MAEMTIEQQRALALARARVRMQQGQQQQQPPMAAQQQAAAPQAQPQAQQRDFQLTQPQMHRSAYGLSFTPPLDTTRTAPPELGPAPQSDFSYRAGRAIDLTNNVVRATTSGIPIVGGLADRAAGPSESFNQFQQDHPIMSQALPVAGAVASMVPVMGAAPWAFGLTQASRPAQYAMSGASGAAIGSVDSTVRGGDPLLGAAAGGAGGVVGTGLGQAVGRVFRGRGSRPPTPSTDEMRERAAAEFDIVKDSGVRVSNDSARGFAAGVLERMRELDFDEDLHPGVAIALRRMVQRVQGEPTINDLHKLRRLFRIAGQDARNPDQARLTGEMIDDLDAFVAGLADDPSQLVGGAENAEQAVTALRNGIATWASVRRAELIEDAFRLAEMRAGANATSAGMGAAIKQQFAAIARNPRRFNSFNQQEQQAIMEVVLDRSPVDQIIRMFGKFAPRGVISATLGHMAGGVPLLIAGEGARRVADASVVRRAEAVGDLIRGGRQQPANDPVTQMARQRISAMAQALAMPAGPRLTSPSFNGLPPKP